MTNKQDMFLDFCQTIEDKTGIVIAQEILNKLENSFINRITEEQLKAYLHELKQYDEQSLEFLAVLESVINNDTYFFRHEQQFDFLENELLPQIWDKKKNDNSFQKLRMLSAGSSTGAEAYTLIIVAFKHLCKDLGLDYRDVFASGSHDVASVALQKIFLYLVVDGIDISPILIKTASEGLFDILNIEGGRGKFKEWDLFLIPVDDTPIDKQLTFIAKAHPLLRSVVNFSQGNLRDAIFKPAYYDIIFCRNVLMYNSETNKKKIINNLYNVLNYGGYLFMGTTDIIDTEFLTSIGLKAVSHKVFKKDSS